MKVFVSGKIIVGICCVSLSLSTVSAQVLTRTNLSERSGVSSDAKSSEENSNGSQDIFDLLISEAKTFYVDALIAHYFKDTSEAKYCFDRLFEIIAEISDLDTLTPLQQDDFNRFYETVSNDYQQNYSYLSNDVDLGSSEIFREELFSASSDSVDLGEDTLVILVDKPGHIPLLRSRKIDRIVDFLTTREARRFQYFLDNMAFYREHLEPILKEYGLPEELIYLPLIESGYNPNAYSYAHAVGLWQFIAGTGARYGLRRNWWIDERRDPIKATHAAAKYLKKLYEEFEDWFLALAAYNTGELRVWRAIRREGTRDYFKLRSLPRQTRDYVPNFMASMLIAKNPEKYGFRTNGVAKWEWEEVVVNKSYEFDAIARACGVDVETIRRFNPELRRWVTPPNEKEYVLRVPVGKGDQLLAQIDKIPEAPERQKAEWISHRVKKNENLSSIARKYGTSVSAIVSANHIKRPSQIRVGQVLTIPTDSYYKRPVEKKASAQKEKISTASKGTNEQKITYIVNKGDSLYSIAKKYNVTVNDIIRWNNLSHKTIYPRQRLTIYPNAG